MKDNRKERAKGRGSEEERKRRGEKMGEGAYL
jgi:hypothetical protein